MLGEVTASGFNSQASALNRAVAELKNQVGAFLSNEKVLYDLEPRIVNLINFESPTIPPTAKLLKSKEESLLGLQKSIEADAIAFMGQAGSFKTKIDTNPKYSFLKTKMTTWGLRQLEILKELAQEVSPMLQKSAAMSARLLTQNKNVKTLVGELDSLEKAATGRGLMPKIQGILSGTIQSTIGETAKSLQKIVYPIAIAGGVGLVVYLMILKRK